MEITIDRNKADVTLPRGCESYTVTVSDKRILTILTDCKLTIKKWVQEIQKTHGKRRGNLVISLCADRVLSYQKGGLFDNPYRLLQLCLGSQCLIIDLPDPLYDSVTGVIPKALKDLLYDPNTTVVGLDIERIAKKLEKDHGLKVTNFVEIGSLVAKGLKRNFLDGFGVDQLAKIALGKNMHVLRPSKIEWCDRDSPRWWTLSEEKLKYAALDAFLCFEIGIKFLGKNKGGSS